MAYSTLDNLLMVIPEQELKNLTNDTYPAEEINNEKVAGAIEYADEFINSFLRNKYLLPLKYVPMLVQKLSTDIAAYRLYSRRPKKLPEHIVESYNESKKILISLKKEEMILDLPSEHPEKDVTPPAKMVVTNSTKSSKIFNDNIWRLFR